MESTNSEKIYKGKYKLKTLQEIKDAKADEKYRAPHPLGNCIFPDQNFIYFEVM